MIVSVFIGGFIAMGILDLVLRKKFNIVRNERFMDQFINKKHFIFEIVLYVLFLGSVSVRGLEGKPLYIMLLLFFSVIFALRGAAELIFRREQRKYLISYTYSIICLLCGGIILLF